MIYIEIPAQYIIYLFILLYMGTSPLQAMGADPDTVTVSGFSSGASMAGTLHMIYSETI